MALRFNWPDKRAVAIFLLVFPVGAYSLSQGLRYGLGQINRIDAGAFPAAIGIALMVLSALVLLVPPQDSSSDSEPHSLRGILFVGAAMLAFMVLIQRLGLAPTIFVVTLISGLADRSLRPLHLGMLSLGSAIFCVVIFIVLLGLPLKPFWW